METEISFCGQATHAFRAQIVIFIFGMLNFLLHINMKFPLAETTRHNAAEHLAVDIEQRDGTQVANRAHLAGLGYQGHDATGVAGGDAAAPPPSHQSF